MLHTGLNKSLRPMVRSSTVINASFPLNIAHIEVPRFRAVNEEVPPSSVWFLFGLFPADASTH